MGNEYNGDKIVLRDTNGNQMSLARFFQLALNDGNGHGVIPTQGPESQFNPNHHAWDMATSGVENVVPVRTPVAGSVVSAVSSGYNQGLGVYVVIQEPNGRKHEFLHMYTDSLRVSVGDTVEQGTTLGMIGNTGDSTGAHLHYSVMVNGTRIYDPIEVYDCSTLPAGWNMNGAAAALNWDYIQLDDTATDYGPPGGDTPSEPFFTDKRIYDISTYQSGSKSEQLASDSTTGGFIIKWGQANSTTNYWQDDKFITHLANARAKNIPVGFYFYWEMNPDGLSDADITQLFESVFQYLTDADVKPDNTDLGIWLDFEGAHSSTPANNDHVIELFNQVGTNLDFPVVGFYTYKAYLANFTLANVKDYPFWYSRPGVSKSTVDVELADYGFTAAYIWQDGYPGGGYSPDISYSHTDVDNDTVLKEIPTSGSGGGGGGGSGDYTEVINVTVDVVPPKRIYFDPVPGLISPETDLISDREATVSITTDADSAILYYTVDGSSPYVYTTSGGNVVYTIAETAQLYSEPIVITRDSHIRVVAVPIETVPGDAFEKPLAKASATYLFRYTPMVQDWDAETKSYAISDGNVSFFEENRQAFLQLHEQLTDEEILYTEPYKHDTQSEAQDAEDNASTVDPTNPMVNSSDTSSEGDSDVSDS